MIFDFYFSNVHGLILELPFLSLKISALAVYALIVSIVALRIRKVVVNRKQSKAVTVEPSTPSVFDIFENDWSN